MSKRPRRSRAKRLGNADLARIDVDLANVTEDENPYAEFVRPTVDREALLRAVRYHQFDFILATESARRTIDLDTAGKWRRLCLIRAAKRELLAMEQELEGVVPDAHADDPRNSTPVTKEKLWRLAHPQREPRNTAEVSRWFTREVSPSCDPVSVSRSAVTINLRLFADLCGVPLSAIRKALP